MKKIYLLGIVALAIALPSCNSKDDDYSYTSSNKVTAVNIITSIEDETTVVSEGNYQFQYKFNSSDQVGSVSSSSIVVNNNSYGFETVETSYKSTGYDFYLYHPQSTTNNLTEDVFYITQLFYYPSMFMEPPFSNPYNIPQYMLIAQYTLDNKYNVKTFQKNTVFLGETVTRYPDGQGGTATFSPGQSSDEKPMVYQLSLDIEKNKADIIIYNAKFAPPSPLLSQVFIQGLDVDFTGGMVRVKGENIVPKVPEGGELTPYERFMFNSIELMTTNSSLTECEIAYTVASVFKGNFTGSYIVDTKLLN